MRSLVYKKGCGYYLWRIIKTGWKEGGRWGLRDRVFFSLSSSFVCICCPRGHAESVKVATKRKMDFGRGSRMDGGRGSSSKQGGTL